MKFQGIEDIILKSVKQDRYEKYKELLPDFKSEKSSKLLTSVLTIVASIILGIFAINPTLTTIAGLQKQLDDDKNYEAQLQQKITDLSALEQEYKNMQNDLPFVYDAVPRTPQVATLTATLQTIVASESAVKLTNLQTVNVDLSKDLLAGKKYSAFEYDVSMEGDYQTMLNVINEILNFQRILTVNSISFVKVKLNIGSAYSASNTNNEILQCNVSGNAYYQP